MRNGGSGARSRSSQYRPARVTGPKGNEERSRNRWEAPEVAKQFAERPPDHRLVQLFAASGEYASVHESWRAGPNPRVLDVGSAGGRNTVWLASEGADVLAVDASHTMVAETRKRLAAVIGEAEAAARVRHGYIDDLSAYATGGFDLVVALGVLQNAQSDAEWGRALNEVARVLRVGGLALVANFSPESAPRGVPLAREPGTDHVWRGFGGPGSLMTLPDMASLDEHFRQRGMLLALPTESLRVATDAGHRVTLNALYRKA